MQNQVRTVSEQIFGNVIPTAVITIVIIISLFLVAKVISKLNIEFKGLAFFAYAAFIFKDLINTLTELLKDIMVIIIQPLVENAQQSGKNIQGLINTYTFFERYNIFFLTAFVIILILILLAKPSNKKNISNDNNEIKNETELEEQTEEHDDIDSKIEQSLKNSQEKHSKNQKQNSDADSDDELSNDSKDLDENNSKEENKVSDKKDDKE